MLWNASCHRPLSAPAVGKLGAAARAEGCSLRRGLRPATSARNAIASHPAVLLSSAGLASPPAAGDLALAPQVAGLRDQRARKEVGAGVDGRRAREAGTATAQMRKPRGAWLAALALLPELDCAIAVTDESLRVEGRAAAAGAFSAATRETS